MSFGDRTSGPAFDVPTGHFSPLRLDDGHGLAGRVFLVTPKTLLRWHRELVRFKWARHSKRRPGRPPPPAEVQELTLRLAKENPRWGYKRIQGELLKLGIKVSATAIRKLLGRRGLGPAPRRGGTTWRQFLAQQASSMMALRLLHH